MNKDLRSFLKECESDVMRIPDAISVRYELTAMQYALWERGLYPVILAEHPRLDDGRISAMQAVTNLTASREMTARVLGVSDHRTAARELSEMSKQSIAPIVVDSRTAPCKEMIFASEDATVDGFPVFTQHQTDVGPYLTAAHATTYDPDTGIDNTAIQRCWVKSGRRLGYFPYPASHNRKNINKFWERGEDAPMAIWIGHHPAVSMGTQAKLGYPESHWAAAGGISGSPVRLVPTELFGDAIRVPADAEIVLEGFVPRDLLESEGGFGEYTGFAGAKTMSPVFDVKVVTRRRDAIYHDYGSGLPDSLVPDNMMIESKLFEIAKGFTDSVGAVHVPVSGRRFHAYLSVADASSEKIREMMRALLGFRRVKHVVVVGPDIDVFDEQQVLWAVATRTQMSRDALMVDGLEGSALDPSLTGGTSMTSKIGIDATGVSSAAVRSTIPREILDMARRRLRDGDGE